MIYFAAQTNNLQTPLARLYHWEKETPNRLYLNQPVQGIWNAYTWGDVALQTRRMAAAIKAMNLPEKSHIAICSKNCAHWMMADYAIWMAGHVSIPLYPNLNNDTVRKILDHSGAKFVFIGKLDDQKEILAGVPENLPIVAFPYEPCPRGEQWDDLIKAHQPLSESPLRDLDDIATIIYTSGTTGDPKGVVHTFRAIAFAATNAGQEFSINEKDRFFSYLPLAHVAERLLAQLVPLYRGASVSFAESLALFPQNIQETSPTIFLAVPRLWTKFKSKILDKLPEEKLNRLLKIPVVNKLVKRKIRKGLGCHKARFIASGAAALPEALQTWFAKLDINIQDCYAMTENLAYSFVARPHNIRVGYSGQPLPGVNVKINEEGEVLIKSDADMIAYYKNPEETSKIFTEDGFIRTGDLGQLTEQGFLKITGRAKDNFKTSKGKYVAPSPIEKKFSTNSHIEQICIVGDGLSQPLALVVLSETSVDIDPSIVTSELEESRKSINQTLDQHEQIHKIIVIKEAWSPENNFLTPTLKVKRNIVEQSYRPSFDSWVSEKTTVIWQK